MNILLVKIKNRLKNELGYKKIISDETIYTIPSDIKTLKYDPNTLLDEHSWFVIENFSQHTFCIPIITQNEYNSVDYLKMDINEFSKIDYICSIQNDNLFFQKVYPSQLIVKKRLMHLGDDFKYEPNSISLVVNKYPDAIYLKSTNKLFFKKLESISSIFRGIEILYREATDDEVCNFMDSDFIAPKDKIEFKNIGKQIRKKMAIAIDALNKFSADEKKLILEYTKEKSGLKTDNEKFIITNEKDLDKLLVGIQERYYETPVSKEQRVANSVIKLENY